MARTEHICVIGSAGMLGRELVSLLEAGTGSDTSGTRLTAFDIDDLDITKRYEVLDTFAGLQPTLVINAAAYTDVDSCEREEMLARAVNATGPANLAEACAKCEARLVHVSTDYVFDGAGRSPYLPEQPINPQNAYGRTKAEGEAEVRRLLPGGHLIVRTSWLFGHHGKNFVKTILRLGAERDELRVVTDQVGRPTYAPDLAGALLAAGRMGANGTLHFCNTGACSWNEFAVEIIRLGGLSCQVLGQSSEDLKRPARRPAYSVLSTDSFTRITGMVPRFWQDALAECVLELKEPSNVV